jgi:hypothetical protein
MSVSASAGGAHPFLMHVQEVYSKFVTFHGTVLPYIVSKEADAWMGAEHTHVITCRAPQGVVIAPNAPQAYYMLVVINGPI